MDKSSRDGVSHWRQDLTTASLGQPDALSLLQVPALFSGEHWLLAETWREQESASDCRCEEGAKSRSWFGVGCGCHKDGDYGQGGKSPGGAGLSPFRDRRVQLCSETPKTGSPIVKWGWKYLWQVIQSLCIVAAGISAHLALGRALMHPHGLLGPAKSVLLLDPRMSTTGPTAPQGGCPWQAVIPPAMGRSKGHRQPQPGESSAHKEPQQCQTETKPFLNTNRTL